MPIPPRPIPTASRPTTTTTTSPRHRPGSSVPRKSAISHCTQLDWRAEVALLSDLPHTQLLAQNQLRHQGKGQGVGAGKGQARSVPSGGWAGVMVISAESAVRGRHAAGEDGDRRREVPLEGLIIEGKGKREKRATTATTLGFDFIANPSIFALPETATMGSKENPRASPLALSLSLSVDSPGQASPALSNTPSTPALIPHSHHAHPSEEDEADLLDWEYVGHESDEDEEEGHETAMKEMEDEDDVIVLGELELDDPSPALIAMKGAVKTRGKGLSYAAALGTGKAGAGEGLSKSKV